MNNIASHSFISFLIRASNNAFGHDAVVEMIELLGGWDNFKEIQADDITLVGDLAAAFYCKHHKELDHYFYVTRMAEDTTFSDLHSAFAFIVFAVNAFAGELYELYESNKEQLQYSRTN